MKHSFYLFLTTLWAFTGLINAQTPANSTFQNNNVRAVVNANGAMFTDFQQGQFVPLQAGLAEKTLLWGSGIWMAGIDANGTLRGAVQVGNQSDFQPGLYDADLNMAQDINNIWRVNRSDIDAHLADFQDNGEIDQPNAAVFAWPGNGNPNSGFNLPQVFHGLAGFYDEDADDIYAPEMGDYPRIDIRGCLDADYSSSLAWFVNNDVGNGQPHPSGLLPLKMEIQTQVFNFKAPSAGDLLNNTILVGYKFIYQGSVPLDSFYLGLYNDFSIGNPDDDFIGSDPGLNLMYGYNSDENDENGFGTEIPVMAMSVVHGPIDTSGNEMNLHYLTVLDSADYLQSDEFYNVLRGKKPNGTPTPENGWMYGGNPNHPDEVSEISTGSLAGHRVGVSAFGPFSIKPGAVNVVFAAYYYVHEPGNTPLQNVQRLYDQTSALRHHFDTGCFAGIEEANSEIMHKAPDLLLYPNPTTDEFTVESKGNTFNQIEITDLLGRPVQQINLDQNTRKHTITTSGWPAGLYAVRAGGQVKTLVVSK